MVNVRILFLVISLSVVTMQAQESNEIRILAINSRTTPTNVPLAQCAQIDHSYVDQLNEIRKLQLELKQLIIGPSFDHPRIIEVLLKLKSRLKEFSALARPEWNTESFPLNIQWEVERTFFTDGLDDRYLDIKRRINDDLNNVNNDEFRYFLDYKPVQIQKIEIISAHMIGDENNDIKEFFTFDWNLNGPSGILLKYKKKSTVLELCQFLDTIEFVIDVHYLDEMFSFAPLNLIKRFKLIKYGKI